MLERVHIHKAIWQLKNSNDFGEMIDLTLCKYFRPEITSWAVYRYARVCLQKIRKKASLPWAKKFKRKKKHHLLYRNDSMLQIAKFIDIFLAFAMLQTKRMHHSRVVVKPIRCGRCFKNPFSYAKKILRGKMSNIMVSDNNFPGFKRFRFPRRKVSAKQYLQIRGAKVES